MPYGIKGKTVLVTGAAGFIGSHLCERLLAERASVVAFDDLSTGKREHLAACEGKPGFAFLEGDANDRTSLARAFAGKKIDYVFHYAALLGVKNVIERPLDVFRDVDGVRALLDLSREHGVKKVVYASSSEAYGEPLELPEREDGPLNADVGNPYMLVKLVGESLMRATTVTRGLPTVSLRFFNVYGPRQDASPYGFVVGIFLRQALAGEPLTIFGDGAQTRDFVYVEDNVEAVIRALESDKTDGQTLNVGAGKPITIRELAGKVMAATGLAAPPVFAPKRALEILHRDPDVTRLRTLLGFEPAVSLEEGLRRTLEWMRKEGNMGVRE